MPACAKRSAFAAYLLREGVITEAVLERAERVCGDSLIRYLAAQGVLPSNVLAEAVSAFFDIPLTDVQPYMSADLPTERLDKQFMQDMWVVPVGVRGDVLDVLMVDPAALHVVEAVQFYTGLYVHALLARYDELRDLLQHVVGGQTVVHQESVVHFVQDMIQQAVQRNASDIHFEVYAHDCRVRFRQDGILLEVARPPKDIAARLAARVKVMAKLDISEHRAPQDGRCTLQLPDGQSLDLRVNSCPTLYGEKIVVRLLRSDTAAREIEALCFTQRQQVDFVSAIEKPQGLVIVSGPTGSGKTVTLYAALKHLNTVARNISTVEDPVEINVEGINQVHVNVKANLTFAACLRAFLRQDPDVIMVGEIRDLETAEIAIKAAQTGHLVLSTLHTNSAVESLVRLRNMGIAHYNIASAVRLLTAQRLVRKLCAVCKQSYVASRSICQKFALPLESTLYKAVGCAQCYQGYKGRIAVHEVIPIDAAFSDLIAQTAGVDALQERMRAQGIANLRERGIAHIQQGDTSVEEVCRVLDV